MAIALNDRVGVVSERIDAIGTRLSPALLAAVRILTGLVWLQNAGWKTPPDFGKGHNGGLYGYTHNAIDAPVFDPFTWVVRHMILPNWTVFGWLTLVAEATIGALLIIGLWTRTLRCSVSSAPFRSRCQSCTSKVSGRGRTT